MSFSKYYCMMVLFRISINSMQSGWNLHFWIHPCSTDTLSREIRNFCGTVSRELKEVKVQYLFLYNCVYIGSCDTGTKCNARPKGILKSPLFRIYISLGYIVRWRGGAGVSEVTDGVLFQVKLFVHWKLDSPWREACMLGVSPRLSKQSRVFCQFKDEARINNFYAY